jgi:subtilisin-like proprotein convertase family protein
MNTRNLFAVAGLALAVAAAQPARAQLTNTDFSILSFNANDAVVPDGSLNGLALSHDVEGFSGPIADLRVTLNLAGGWNGDLYAYLVHGSGFSVLLNRVGVTSSNPFGFGDPGMSVTFSDTAASDIHLFGSNGGLPLSGVWQPDGRNVDPTTVLDLSSRSAMLDSFDGLDPNGTWTLFIADLSTGDQTMVQSWGLEIRTVPEPTSLCLISGGLAWLWIRRRNRLPNGR